MLIQSLLSMVMSIIWTLKRTQPKAYSFSSLGTFDQWFLNFNLH